MEAPLLVDKPVGATPLEALGLLRASRPEFAGAKLAYAGRLDPMASGLLLVLHGDLLAVQEQFWNLPKAYEAEVILGAATDTYDLLGLAETAAPWPIAPERILAGAQALVGRSVRPVPPFSSIVHDGKPLFVHARAGSLPAERPHRRMDVSEVTVADVGHCPTTALGERIAAITGKVHGDFRQTAIAARWADLLAPHSGASWTAVTLHIACSAGTYVRTLADELGRRLGTGGVLAGLRRTRIGPWRVGDETVVRLS